MNRAEISEKVAAIIADVLSLKPSDVTLLSRLISDLGAESLDFLDIVFQLEDAFLIKINRGEIERAVRGAMSEAEFAPDGLVSEAGLARLREHLPEAAPHIRSGLRAAAIPALFTVETFVKIVERRLGV